MATAISNLENALKDLLESYMSLESELEDTHADDDDAFSSAIVEALEGALEIAIDEFDTSSQTAASLIGAMSEALEQLDPSAFDEELSSEFEMGGNDEMNYDIDDNENIDLDE